MTNLKISEWLTTGLGEFTVGWLLLTIILGGALSASIKFLFETVAPEKIGNLSRRRRVKQQVTPILQSAVSDLEARLNRIAFDRRSEDWLKEDVFNELEDGKGFLDKYHSGIGYFALSTIYSVVRLFAALEILRRLAEKSDMFDLHDLVGDFIWIVRGLDSLRVDEPVSGLMVLKNGTDFNVLTRHIQSSLGRFVLSNGSDHPDIISFAEFVALYQSNDEFRKWMKCIEGYIRGLKTSTAKINHGDADQRLVRLVAFGYFLALYLERSPMPTSSRRWANELRSGSYLTRLGLEMY